MDRRMSESLDRYITGNYGEDQFKPPFICEDCDQEFLSYTEFEDHPCPNSTDNDEEVNIEEN